MKPVTVTKILTRYAKSLLVMEQEATAQGYPSDAEHYKIDRLAMEEAIKTVERSNT